MMFRLKDDYRVLIMCLLDGKVCLITGTNRGIGKALLNSFSREKATIYANARVPGSLDTISSELMERDGSVIIPVYFDIRDTTIIKETMIKIQKEQKKLDILVNNAGIMRDALIGMIPSNLIQEVFETNVFASMETIQYASRLMKKNKSGVILNFASVVGVYGNKGQMVYSASKGAVIAMTKTAAKELAQYNIRVNAVAPGIIDTDLLSSTGKSNSELSQNISFGRLGSPEEVADTCVMLASDYCKYMTGQIIGIDGGIIM